MEISLSLTSDQHAELRRHLFPGDGKEAAAILLCGRRSDDRRVRLVTRAVKPVPHDECERSADLIVWPTDLMVPWLEEAAKGQLSLVKVHSHPTGYGKFSTQDDKSDRELFPCIDGWMETSVPHLSAVMLPDGRIFGRRVDRHGAFHRLSLIAVVGDDLQFWRRHDFGHEAAPTIGQFAERHAKAFGERTTRELNALSIAVVGCSGTGSPVITQLAHLGVGRLVLIDPDSVHELNLNRILHATMADAKQRRLKVDVLGDAVARMGLGTIVERYPVNLYTPQAVKAAAGCDLVIGCVDTAEARFVLNLIANFYTLPYIDVGVTLEADVDGELLQVCGYIHYLKPGGSSLLSRAAITLEDVRAEGTKRQNPVYYEQQRRAGYIRGVEEGRPAVVSVNMTFAALAVNELIGRIHPFRERPNHAYAKIGLSLSELALYPEPESGVVCRYMSKQVGKGDIVPLLNLPELSEP